MMVGLLAIICVGIGAKPVIDSLNPLPQKAELSVIDKASVCSSLYESLSCCVVSVTALYSSA